MCVCVCVCVGGGGGGGGWVGMERSVTHVGEVVGSVKQTLAICME